ncbi:hypothetical protein [Burkholderia arboris]|uniref:hypothetical protein n=1 Tax=Burkholderia arboris TaxID=488730 RepID=UPI001CF2C156|nr:hypothetical protein [Burkholderia arboris]MCA8045528.1 hypothetical protein [Burkholderia arboris]
MNKTLTAADRATIMDACQSISRSADALKAGCSIDGEWPDADDKAFYDAELRLLERLTALLAAQQPEPHAEATDWNTHCTGCSTPRACQYNGCRNEPRAEVTDDKTMRLIKTMSDIIHDQTVAMQSAIIEWQHGKGAKAGLSWIVNTLEGPGHLPDFDAPHGKHAQFWFNANQANPLPKCFCGNPSSSLWMGQGFCCDEHHREAKAKHDAARAGEGQ